MAEEEVCDFLETGNMPRLLKSVPEAKRLVSVLTCPVCYTLMASPVMTTTGCSHNFCSMCVRSYLTMHQNCPSCLQELHESQIKPNKVLQDVITFSKLLLVKFSNTVYKELDDQPNPSVVAKCVRETPRISESQTVQSSPDSRSTEDEAVNDNDSDETAALGNLVSCPVCGVNVPNTVINRHLDECLAGEISGPSCSSSTQSTTGIPQKSSKKNTMRPVTKVVYTLLKDSQIKDLVRKEGLDTKGDRKTLINRHKKFSVIWNAQCEEDDPKSRAEIIRMVKREEQNLNSVQLPSSNSNSSSSLSSQSTNGSLFNYDRKTDPSVIEEKQKDMLKKNQSQFSKLIADLRNRRAEPKVEKLRSSIAVVNDGDLEVACEEETVHINHEENQAINNVSTESEDEFFTDTPQKDVFQKSFKDRNNLQTSKSCESPEQRSTVKILTNAEPDSFSVNLKPGETPTKLNSFNNGRLYVTPKRKTSRELLFDPPKRLRQQVIESPKKAPVSSKSECPVCQSLVQVSLMSSHVDRCLEQSSSKVETRRSKRAPCSKRGIKSLDGSQEENGAS